MPSTPPARRPRRRRKALAAVLLAIVALVAALPWLAGSGLGRSRISAGINRAFAPGRLEFASIRLSWFAPTRLEGYALLDPSGRRVASGPSAVIDRSFGRLLLGGRGPITLTLDGAALEVERSPGGSIDLVEALRGLFETPDPDRDLVVKIARGTLRFRDASLAGPITADALYLALRIAPSPHPISWDLRLAQRDDAELVIQGDFDRWHARGGPAAKPELQVGIQARRWPFAVGSAGIKGTGRLDGSADLARKRGRWKLSGDARLLALSVLGPTLAGDALALDRLDAGWNLAEGDEGWSIRRLAVTSPFGEIKAEGQLAGLSGAGKQRVEGRLDLAAIARQLPRALRLRDGLTVDRGSARLTVDIEAGPGRSTYDVEARLADLAARDRDRPFSLRDPATLTARLIRDRGGDSRVERLALKSSFLDATASGRLGDGVTLVGTLDLAALRRQVGDWVDLGKLDLAGRAEVAGTYQVRPDGTGAARPEGATDAVVRAAPPLYEGSLTATIRDLRVEGVGPSPIRADSVSLELAGHGQAEVSGLPGGYRRLGLAVFPSSRSNGVKLILSPRPRSTGVTLSAWGPSPSPRIARMVSAQVEGDWSPEARAFSFGMAEVRLARQPDDPPGPMLALLARGRLDLAAGVLALDPLRADVPTAFAIAPEGVRVSGIGQGLASLKIDGGLTGDLAAFGLEGRWSAIAAARGDVDGVQVSARVAADPSPGSTATVKAGRPTSLAVRAHYSPEGDRVDLHEFTVLTAFGTLDASGKVEDPGRARRVDLRGTVAPDFAAITALLARRVEPGARVEGAPRKFRASGTIGEGRNGLDGLDAEVGFDLALADVYGMRFGPSAIILRADRGRLRFEPISTTLNEGHVRLEPEIDLEDPAGPTLRLAKNSTIRDARINDEVSRRVLAYVAPILDRATRASGRVSVDLDHAEFPIGPGRGRQARVEGAVVFEDVQFAPGPLANDLLGAIGRRDASIKLDRPVTLTVADGRINQRGLAIPIGDLTRIELAGWVDFDRNLSLTATLPVTPAMLGNNEFLADIAAGTQVRVPITGTLDRPNIDRDALAANLGELGKSLLTRGATRGAVELLMRLGRPKDPNAPPPPTPEERKALRLERKAEKKALRQGMPPGP